MSIGEHRPLGRTLWDTTQTVNRAFEHRLAEAGGNRAVWFIFLALARGTHTTQRDLARTVGITDATLTHHLTALEQRGLVTRTRDEHDRRVQRLAFTPEGRAAFERMRKAAIDYDRVLRAALGDDVELVLDALQRLAATAEEPAD
ncbi:MarR family winged helix-turn-helix transcriptional regulator [Luteimicrobium sp. DT211]|uniref:MarR family winged helix-turn-helix transcriptional regulator n=1 Tax=Luteimicrobium sp. DT211 TaxID=3393412 RepID=UPI003CF861CC